MKQLSPNKYTFYLDPLNWKITKTVYYCMVELETKEASSKSNLPSVTVAGRVGEEEAFREIRWVHAGEVASMVKHET